MNISSKISAYLAAISLQQVIAYILVPALAFVATLLVFQLVRAVLYYRLIAFKQQKLGAMLSERVRQVNFITAIVTAAYVALHTVPEISITVTNIAYVVFLIVWIWQMLQLIMGIVNYFTDKAIEKQTSPQNETAYKFLNRLVKFFAFVIAILLVLSNLGYDVTSLVAGLGIGGIAIALAVQNILADVITSFSIIADKPFKPGDFITFDSFSGWVIRIGIKSTRIRSVDGEELVVANSKLVNSVVRNFTSSECRRSVQTLIVSYDNDAKLVQDIPAFVTDILQAQSQIDKEDYFVHMTKFDAAGYIFEVAFSVTHPDQRKFLDVQQEVLFAITNKLQAEKIKFA